MGSNSIHPVGLAFLIRWRWATRRGDDNALAAKGIQPDWCARGLTRYMLGNGVQRAVNSRVIEVALELAELPLEIRHDHELSYAIAAERWDSASAQEGIGRTTGRMS